jgi:hypothetical protein
MNAQLHALAVLHQGEEPPDTHQIGGWVGPRTSLDDLENRKLLIPPGLELRPLGHPVPNQSLYRLRYLGSSSLVSILFIYYILLLLLFIIFLHPSKFVPVLN